MANGNDFCAKAKSSTQISVVFEGFKADGTTSTGTVKYTVQDGTNSLKSWQYVDLSSLGEISSLKVNYEASEDMKGKYGYNAPAYIAFPSSSFRFRIFIPPSTCDSDPS